ILPTVVKNLLIINGLVFLAQITLPKIIHVDIDQVFALHYWGSDLFRPYQFVTHLFMHGSFEHIFFNMFALWMFGSILENVWGPKRFLIFYMICGLGAALCYMLVLTWQFHQLLAQNGLSAAQVQQMWYDINHNINGDFNSLPVSIQQIWIDPTLGASGAIFGLLVAFGYLFPNSMIYIYFFLPMKAKYFVGIYILVELFLGIRNSPGDNVAHFAHLGGALVGFILLKIWNSKNRQEFY
ncbi:MAG: rhomboid family intramembrane serine protease, partial [Chitinophagaceae bacterium]